MPLMQTLLIGLQKNISLLFAYDYYQPKSSVPSEMTCFLADKEVISAVLGEIQNLNSSVARPESPTKE